MHKRTVSIIIALTLVLMAVPFLMDFASAADSAPVFGSDLSDSTATTGDAFDFEINVTDDYNVVGVSCEYWYGSGSSTNTSMSLTGLNWTLQITIPSGSTDTLYYRFHSYDNASQYTQYPSAVTNVSVAVTDNDDPTITADNSPTAGTTGDTYTWDISASDNIGVNSATITYSHGTVSGTNVLMTDDLDGTYSYSITLDDSLSSLTYAVTVSDSAGNSVTQTQQTVAVTDNDNPSLTDSSASVGTTGDSFFFDVAASDNIALQYVNLTYSHNTVTGTNVSMTNDGDGTYSYTITLDHSTANLVYAVNVIDTSGNKVTTGVTLVTVNDNDPPWISADNSPSTGTTGDSYTFDITPFDNIGVSTVTAQWTHDTLGATTALSNDGDGTWSASITLDDSTEDMTYAITITDTAANSMTGSDQTVTVSDNDDPSLDADNSPSTGTTGDGYTFDITASDNVDVDSVTVTWSHGSLGGTNTAMTDDGDGTWSLTITLDNSLSSMTYTVTVSDAGGNSVSGSQQTVTVTDNDNPTFTDNSPSTGTTADSYTFDISASDNIGIQYVRVSYTHDTVSGTNVNLVNDGDGTYSLTITLADSTASLTYTITLSDTSSNVVTGSQQTRTVVDNDNPSLTADNSPTTGTTGDSYTWDISASDNIGVSSVRVTWAHSSLGGTNVAMSNDGDGTWSLTVTLAHSLSSMTYTVTVSDAAGNSVSGSQKTVTISDNDNPTFTDNSPTAGTTADSYTFSITASDNIAVQTVTVTYSHSTVSGTNVPLALSGGVYRLTITLADSTANMLYTITVRDTSANSVTGSQKTVTVTDNDAPRFANPSLNPSPPTTGDSLSVSVDITDNIALNTGTIVLRYNFGSGYLTTSSFTQSTNRFTFTLSTPSSATSLSYYITASDNSGNAGTSATWTSSVSDNDNPTLTADNSPGSGTTGDSYTFSVQASDNIQVNSVRVTWSHGSLSGTDQPLAYSGGTYTRTITLDHAITPLGGSMSYTLTIRDTSGNSITTSPRTITVTDNDNPTIETDHTPSPATTGDSFTFSIEVDDNIDGANVLSVTLKAAYGNDWSNSFSPTMTYNSGGNGYWEGTTTVSDTLQNINYNITVTDRSGNLLTRTGYVRPVIDNDDPSITGDSTPTGGTTGDPFNFTMTADDNIAVAQVYVNYAYVGGNSYDMVAMTEGPSGWYVVEILEDTTVPMVYNFTVIDTSMNSLTGPNKSVTITDNDNPWLYSDMSDTAAEAGKDFVFKVMASDNIAVASVSVEYWYSFNSQHTTTPMAILSGNIYYLEHTLPAEPGTLYYVFNTVDVNGNPGSSPEKTVEILDITPPVISDVVFNTMAYTGNQFTVTATVTDDVEVNYARMWYYFGDKLPTTPEFVTGTPSGSDFTFTITIPDSLDDLHFWLMSVDMEGNMVQTGHYIADVQDDDLPEAVLDLSDTSSTTGDPFMFKFNATDNIAVGWVNVTYMLPGMEAMTVTMEVMDMTYYLEIDVPNERKGTLTYHFTIYDTSMNMLMTDEVEVEVADDEKPVAVIQGPADTYQHEQVTFTASGSSDNVGITSYAWEINGESFSGISINYTFDIVGVYMLELKVSDGVNPTVTDSWEITVKDADDPVIVIDLPDVIGNHLMLDANASASTDNVGIVSYTWLLILPDNTRITGMGPVFQYPMEGVLKNITLYLTVADKEGNSAQGMYTIRVVDNLPPTVIAPADVEEYEGVFLTFTDDLSYDNVGIREWVWTISAAGIEVTRKGSTMSYFFETPGRYNITLTVFDSANNSASDYFIVNIREKGPDYDTDGDGMPDQWEIKYGLDPNLDDSRRDYDSDQLINLKEYELHTNPKSSDSDGDGMPDNYEYRYAFNINRTDEVRDGVPRWMDEFTAEGDLDGDGTSNLDEYLDGYRDPTVQDAPEEKEDNTGLYITIAVIILVLVLVIMMGVVYILSKVKPVEEELPEGRYPHLYKNVETVKTPEEK
ncbi:MAG: PKD domain-containing protein [Thermoplasmatota archaeon]